MTTLLIRLPLVLLLAVAISVLVLLATAHGLGSLGPMPFSLVVHGQDLSASVGHHTPHSLPGLLLAAGMLVLGLWLLVTLLVALPLVLLAGVGALVLLAVLLAVSVLGLPLLVVGLVLALLASPLLLALWLLYRLLR